MGVVLVGHALPVRIDGGPGHGPADPGLAERGFAQAERVIQGLAGDHIDAVYVSPALRAQQTARPLLEALGLPHTEHAGIAEFDTADSSYVPTEELKATN